MRVWSAALPACAIRRFTIRIGHSFCETALGGGQAKTPGAYWNPARQFSFVGLVLGAGACVLFLCFISAHLEHRGRRRVERTFGRDEVAFGGGISSFRIVADCRPGFSCRYLAASAAF